MATPTKFQTFVTDMAAGTHADAINAQTDTLKVSLCLTSPSASLDSLFADLPTETTGTGYTAGGEDALNTTSTASGAITVGASGNPSWTAGAADWDDFRYVTLYNSTPAGGPLIMYWDYGSTVSLGNGETFTVNVTTNYLTVL